MRRSIHSKMETLNISIQNLLQRYFSCFSYYTWTVPSDGGSPITKYVVLRDGVRLVTLTATSTGPTSYTDNKPPSGTHVYQVKAVNAIGSGQLSNKVTVSVP